MSTAEKFKLKEEFALQEKKESDERNSDKMWTTVGKFALAGGALTFTIMSGGVGAIILGAIGTGAAGTNMVAEGIKQSKDIRCFEDSVTDCDAGNVIYCPFCSGDSKEEVRFFCKSHFKPKITADGTGGHNCFGFTDIGNDTAKMGVLMAKMAWAAMNGAAGLYSFDPHTVAQAAVDIATLTNEVHETKEAYDGIQKTYHEGALLGMRAQKTMEAHFADYLDTWVSNLTYNKRDVKTDGSIGLVALYIVCVCFETHKETLRKQGKKVTKVHAKASLGARWQLFIDWSEKRNKPKGEKCIGDFSLYLKDIGY